MAESKPESSTAASGAETEQTPPPLLVNAQYVKDLSFENPRAPASLSDGQRPNPNVNVAIDVNARRMQEKRYEVVLSIRAEASHDEATLFLAEVHYAGLFTIGDVPKEAIEPLLLVNAPHLLFPFARAIIADSVRDGGFAPLMVHPIDFASLYRQRKQERAEARKGDGKDGDGRPSDGEGSEPAAP